MSVRIIVKCSAIPRNERQARVLVYMTPAMLLSVFMAGPDRVRWELTALGPHGSAPFRLVINHSNGAIIEYFDDVTRALLRESELEALLVAARSTSMAQSDLRWNAVGQLTHTAH